RDPERSLVRIPRDNRRARPSAVTRAELRALAIGRAGVVSPRAPSRSRLTGLVPSLKVRGHDRPLARCPLKAGRSYLAGVRLLLQIARTFPKAAEIRGPTSRGDARRPASRESTKFGKALARPGRGTREDVAGDGGPAEGRHLGLGPGGRP